MEISARGVVVTLSEGDAASLAVQLSQCIQIAYNARGIHPPRLLLYLADEVNRAARSFADVRADAQVRTRSELAQFRAEPFPSSCGEPVWLSADEAARIAEVSVQTMRKCLREGDPQGSRGGHRSAWRVEASELARWLSWRRKERTQKAA